MAAISLFGFEISRAKPSETIQSPITVPVTDDGAVLSNFGGVFGSYVDLENNYKNENDLITRYREMAMQAELESAIDDIINESIVHDITGKSVNILMDDLEQPDNIKEMIENEFKEVLRLLDFSNSGQDVFRRWYIDGRLYYQVLVDQKNPKMGIQQLIYLDPRKIKKIKQVIKTKDQRTGVDVISKVQEFYAYNDKAVDQGTTITTSPVDSSIKLSTDAVVNINSGLLDPKKNVVLSYLHKAIKPLNMLRMVEDAIVIYRISRAPERRVFYVDVGNLPRIKADQYLTDVMNKFRNKVVYDSATGTVKDDRKFMSMMEDYWIPRRGDGKNTEVTTLPAGQNLGELSDVKYFQNRLYNALNVPISRLEASTGFTLGRSTEITRDELKFTKFIERLRAKFSILFDELMQRQLALKGICSIEEWNILKEYIHYDFLKDNNFTELKEAELLMSRLNIMTLIDPYVGVYYSKKWVNKHVLQLNETDQKQMAEEIVEEMQEMPVAPAPEPTTASFPQK